MLCALRWPRRSSKTSQGTCADAAPSPSRSRRSPPRQPPCVTPLRHALLQAPSQQDDCAAVAPWPIVARHDRCKEAALPTFRALPCGRAAGILVGPCDAHARCCSGRPAAGRGGCAAAGGGAQCRRLQGNAAPSRRRRPRRQRGNPALSPRRPSAALGRAAARRPLHTAPAAARRCRPGARSHDNRAATLPRAQAQQTEAKAEGIEEKGPWNGTVVLGATVRTGIPTTPAPPAR